MTLKVEIKECGNKGRKVRYRHRERRAAEGIYQIVSGRDNVEEKEANDKKNQTGKVQGVRLVFQ